MKALFPPLADPNGLPRRVLCVAPHADDEILGCGGMLAMHAERGDDVRVIVLTDGSAGDPGASEADIREAREAESRAAGAALGVTDHRFLGLTDGSLAGRADLAEVVHAEVMAFDPDLVYGPSPQEMHPDHRAVSRALVEVLGGGRDRRVLLYGVNAQVTAGVLFDTTRVFERKLDAVRCFESQMRYHDLVGKTQAVDHARTVNIEDASIRYAEGFADLNSGALRDYQASVAQLLTHVSGPGHGLDQTPTTKPQDASAAEVSTPGRDEFAATAVISTWNKAGEVLENLEGLKRQTRPFERIVVVDNASSDDTVARIEAEHPDVRVIRMPNSDYGACETFNIGFASVSTPLLAILDDDVVLPPEWLERAVQRLAQEPASTAVLSTKVVEPEMPASYLESDSVNRERYMSTFRGCGSLARTDALREAGFYDERLFIYGNERDLTCRLLNLGYRVLQFPGVETFHRQPFGIQMGKRSLYFHARNAWLTMIKYAPLSDLVRLPWLVLTKVLLRSKGAEEAGAVTDATGTIGIGKSIRATKGAWWVLVKASVSVLANVPYCLKHREPVKAPDFELPLS